MIKNKKILLSALLPFFLFCFVVQAKTIVVFIHGTVLPGLSLLDMSDTYKDTLSDDSRYVAAAKRIRNDTRFWEDQAVLGEGLWPIVTIANQKQTVTKKREDRFAVYPLTRAFDAMAHWSGYLEGDVSYYAFGHLGLLSQSYRKEQGFVLYKELVRLVRAAHEPTRIIICAHSHGGNIALYLAEAEEDLRQGLFIDDLLLFGTPVQLETACCAFKKPFKRVVSFFSASDTIQLSDWLSTKGFASFRTFTVPHKQGKCRYTPPQKSYGQVIDMRCQVHGDTRCLTHQNFWYLGRSRRLCQAMDMLPLMVLAPVYVSLLRSHATSYAMMVDAHLDQKWCSPMAVHVSTSCANTSCANTSCVSTSQKNVLSSSSLRANTTSSNMLSESTAQTGAMVSGTTPSCTTDLCEAPACEKLSNKAPTYKAPASVSLSCSLVFPGKITQGLSESEAQQLGKLVEFYDHDAQVSWKPTYKHRILLLYREDFMREMLGLFSWIDFKVRLWGYKTLKSVRQWFDSEQHC